MDETAVREVLRKLGVLAEAHGLEADMIGGDRTALMTDRDKRVAHDASVVSFALAAALLRDAVDAEPDGYRGDDGR